MKKSLVVLLGYSSSMFAEQTCTPDPCTRIDCLGPENIMVNAPVCPLTCSGDISISLSGLYWKASQDGMEYAIDNAVKNNVQEAISGNANIFQYGFALAEMVPIVDAKYLLPKFPYDFGFRLALRYCTPCDGWDLGVNWTSFQSKASSHEEADSADNHVLLPLWSAFAPSPGGISLASVGGPVPFATDISSTFRLNLDLVNMELGREFWLSKLLTLRPYIGLQVALIEQSYRIAHRGGSWDEFPRLQLQFPPTTFFFSSRQPAFNNEVLLDSNFKGIGIRSGLNSFWHLGCGFSLYGELGASIVYGKFDLEHHETNREADPPFTKYQVLETKDHFRASRAFLDLGFGVRWASLICDCKYGVGVSVGWEQHLFFHQNQFWRVLRLLDEPNFLGSQSGNTPLTFTPNNTGKNTFIQRSGTLATQGLTVKLQFDF